MRKLLALTLSLLMVFSVVPMAIVSAEGETYLTMFDASSETASSQIGSIQSSDKNNAKVVTYAVPTGETDADGNPITEDRQVLKFKRTGAYNGCGVGIKADYRSVIKGAIGIRFWMAGDPATFDASDKVSISVQTSSLGYKNATEHQGVWKPTLEGATYEFFWNTTANMYKSGASTMDVEYNAAGKAKDLFTEPFLGQVKQIMFGVDAYSAGSLKEMFYIDDVELIYPEGVTPAPVEFTATFVGTETAQLAEEVPSVKSDAANNDAVVMPEATLAEGTLAGWALNGDIKKVYAPGETVKITNNTTFHAVNANRPALATPAAPVASTVSGSTVVLKAVTGAVYSKDGATWQTSNTFAGLTPGGTYTFYQKMSETLEYAESAVSEGLTVTTPVEYIYEAENCSPKGYKAGTTTAHTISNTYNTADGGVNYKYVQDNSTNAVGAKNVFTVKNLPTGIFELVTYSRNVNTRSKYQVTLVNANGEVVGDFGVADFTDQTYKFAGASYHSANYLENEVTVAEEGTYTLVFTNVKAGSTGMCLDSFTFKKVADYSVTEAKVKIDGEEVAVLEPGATYTIPTPATGFCYTDGETEYYGGEQVVVERYLNLTTKVLTTKVVYTMDEGSRLPDAKSVIDKGDGSVEYLEVNGNFKLALKVQMDRGNYIKLPEDWADKAFYKPTKISFTAYNGTPSSLAFKTLKFSESINSSYCTASGETHDVITSTSYVNPTTYTIDVTEDMYDCFYFSGQMYAPAGWSDNTPAYIYYDNVTIDYEYDFDYVEPVEPTTYDITIDGEVVASVEEGTEYTLPELPAGKYYVGNPETTFVVTESVEFTTATYTYDITVDGNVVATVEYGTEYTLPALEAGKYYVDVTETTFVVTEALSFTTATYTFDITVDGEVVATVEYGTEYTLPALEAGKYYVDVTETTFVVTEALSFTTATYKYDITVDGEVVATVEYGTEYTLPALADGKYYVGNPETTFVVTEALSFTTATYTFDITIDGTVVATVAYGETFTLPAVAEGKQYVDGFVAGQDFVVTEALAFATEDIPEVDGPTTDLVETVDGAAIRLNEVKGMRFYANFKGNLDEVDRMGIIIAPANIVGDYFTMEDDHIDVVYDHVNYDLWEDNQFVGSIVNIADKNITRDFIARAYVVIDGVTYYAETTTVRNIAEIADEFITDPKGNYDSLEADVKAMVDTWAKAND